MSKSKINKKILTGDLRVDYYKLKECVFDATSHLPTLPVMMDQLRILLEKHGALGLITLDLSNEGDRESHIGFETIDKIVRKSAEIMEEFAKKNKNSVLTLRARGDDLLLFLTPSRGAHVMNGEQLASLAEKLQNRITAAIRRLAREDTTQIFEVYAGTTIVYNHPGTRFERNIYNSVKEAGEMVFNKETRERTKNINFLRKIIKEKKIKTVLHPIVDIQNNNVLGYEALSRGPIGTSLEAPDRLFELAHEGKLVFELERLCRAGALSLIRKFDKGHYLFLNNDPIVMHDPSFQALHLFKKYNVPPERVVLEITERRAIKNFSHFKKVLNIFRRAGFKIAIDDAGSGYSSLNAIAALEPDFIKFDIGLIKNIHKDTIKQDLVRAIMHFAEKINTPVIAEGIENIYDYTFIRSIGIPYAQGFLFSKPAPAFPKITYPRAV